jgi:Spy/CpxP family protein refolding chaperone
MKNTNNLKLAICILTILLFGLTACQHHGDRRHSEFENGDRMTDHIVSELDLNEKQETLLNEIVRNLEETRKELGDREELKQILVAQLNSEDLDEEYLRRETARLIRELESASDKFITGLGSFHASLNEEQRQKLSDFVTREKDNRNRHN